MPGSRSWVQPQSSSPNSPLCGKSTLLAWAVGTRNHCGIRPQRIPVVFGDNAEEDCHVCLRLFDILTGRPSLGSSSRKQAQPELVFHHITRGRVVAGKFWPVHSVQHGPPPVPLEDDSQSQQFCFLAVPGTGAAV